MKFYLGVTDNAWYQYLSHMSPEDVNFWQPGGKQTFKVLQPGAPFLFKLKSPINAIGGIGFFSSHTFLPISVAWDTFGERNGCKNQEELKTLIRQYKRDSLEINPTIGCIVLTDPIFFQKEDWIETPPDWLASIVQGKSYSTDDKVGNQIWAKVELLIRKYTYLKPAESKKNQIQLEEEDNTAQYSSILTKVRLGQGAFRILVTDAYSRKCSVTGEKTLPVLEAAHIKPYSESGPHLISNGILLRSDIHKLYDNGYITFSKNNEILVSKRIKEEFENGREYYQYHGKTLQYLPGLDRDKPSEKYVEWHNENVYKG